MNWNVIQRSVGIMLALLGLAMGACVLVGWVFFETRERAMENLLGWGISLGVTFATSVVLLLLSRRRKGKPGAGEMIRKEAIAVVGIGWFMCSVMASLPYMCGEPHLAPDKAFFEGVSGLTTTGATVFGDIESLPRTLLLWRAVTQWLGGMGILAMFVLILAGSGSTGKKMFGAESSLHGSDLAQASIRQTMRWLWMLYAVLTVVCGIGLWLLGMTPFQALAHSLTTTATGGFGTENDSIDGFTVGVKLWIVAFMLTCGVSFPLYIVLLRRRRWSDLRKHEETWWYFALLAIALTMLLLNYGVEHIQEKGVDVLFNTISIATSTGYSVGDYDAWPRFGKGIILMLMVLGGCSGSTSGGLKVSRAMLWLRFSRRELIRVFRPKMVAPLKLNGRPVPDVVQGQLFVTITLAVFFAVVCSLVMHLLEGGVSSFGCISAVVSCLSNIGPAFAEFGPTKNFSSLGTPSTLMLPVLMIIGRLEYVAVLVLFSRRLWRHY